MTNRVLYPLIATGAILLASVSGLKAQQSAQEAISIGSDDIGGVVTSDKGPEAGVWVIAETTELPTKFAKIVVTDDQRALRHPRASEGQLQSLGARLRAGGFPK